MATAGGGHLAAAKAVAAAVEARGDHAVILDGLDVMSHRLRWFQVDFYAWQLEHSPWSYGIGFWLLGRPIVATSVRRLIGLFWGDRLLEAIAEHDPDVVVSTY